jgi:hypothetical protein
VHLEIASEAMHFTAYFHIGMILFSLISYLFSLEYTGELLIIALREEN